MLNGTALSARSPERWTWKRGYEGLYKISSRGQVVSMPRNTTKGGPLKQTLRPDGYLAVSLTKDGRQRTFLVHALVAEAFIGPRPPGDIMVLHGDGDKANNDVDNLRYGTRPENSRDWVRHGKLPANRRPPVSVTVARNHVIVGEVWVSVPGYESSYEVSNFGRVRSLRRRTARGWRGGRILKASAQGKQGYHIVGLSLNGSVRMRYVHHLVAEAFHGPRPVGLVVRHLDGNPANNRATNLVYGTYEENNQDTVNHGRHHNARRIKCGKGHRFTEENTIIRYWPDGSFKQRVCRICLEDWKATSKARRENRAA